VPDNTPIPHRRILFVAYYFPPMGLSGVQRVTKMVKYLAREGWAVDVITVHPGGYFAFDDTLLDDLDDPGIEIHRTRSVDPTRLFSSGQPVSLPKEGRRRLLTGLSQFIFQPDNKVGWVPFAIRRGGRLVNKRSYSAVMASAPPYSALLAARSLAERAGVPFVADFRDDWVGNPRHSYPTKMHRLFSARLERRVLDSADAVLAINRTIADSLAGGRTASFPVQVLPQGFDPEDFERHEAVESDDRNADHPRKTPDPGARSRTFTLLYTGVFYDAQRPDTFLRGLALFLSRRPDAKTYVRARFVGLFRDEGVSLVEELGLAENVELSGYLAHDETVTELLKSDVAWLTIGRRPGAEGISTGKMYEYMGSRKPILALVPPGEAERSLEGYGAARVCDPDDVSGIAAAVEAFYDKWKGGALPSGDEKHIESFDRRRQGRTLSELLKSLVH